MSPTKRRLLAVVVAVLAITAGCTGAGGDSDGGDGQFAGDGEFDVGNDATVRATPVADRAPGGGADEVGQFNAQQFANRQLILTGQVAVEVGDFDSARANLTEATASYGGFVSDTSQQVHRIDNQTWTEGIVVLRVPRGNFTPLFEIAEAEGELLESERNSQDVTDELVDLQARLDNLRAERDQLRTLYERANDTEDILRVQERLSDVQGEIERLEARQQTLQERVALSTITVRLTEDRPEPNRVAPDEWYDVPLLAAFLASIDGVVVTLRALSVAAAYALPYLVVFGVPIAGIGYALRQRRGPGRGGLRGWVTRRRQTEPETDNLDDDTTDVDDGPSEEPDET